MATFVYVAAQDDNKVSIFAMDDDSGALTPAGQQAGLRRPVPAGHQPRSADALRRPSGTAGDYQLPHRPGQRSPDPNRLHHSARPAGLSGHRPRRPVPAVVILRRRQGGGRIPWATTAAWAARRRRWSTRRWAPTPSKPTAPIGSPTCRTSPARTTTCWNRPRTSPRPTSSTSSALTNPPARSPTTTRPCCPRTI